MMNRLNITEMNRTTILLTVIAVLLAAGCTNMNPDVTFDPKTDAKAYCEIGKKHSITANKFWDKVEVQYIDNDMYDELEMFESIILEKSQIAKLDYPIRIKDRKGEITFYPALDAETFKRKFEKDPERALKYWNKVIKRYKEDGCDEYLPTFEDSIRLIAPMGVEMLKGRIIAE